MSQQIAIAYTCDGRTIVYDTVYREQDVRPALDRCIAAKGRAAEVRTIPGPGFPLAK